MRAQFADKTFRSGHVRVRNAVGAVMQVLMRSDIPAAEAFLHHHLRISSAGKKFRRSYNTSTLLEENPREGEEEKMAIEYGAFIVDGLNVKKQTLSLAGRLIGFTDGEGFTGVQNGSEPLVLALARIGPAGWALITGYPNNITQTFVLIFSRQQ
jgi:hypothetical protein